jgi:hypothetical protein
MNPIDTGVVLMMQQQISELTRLIRTQSTLSAQQQEQVKKLIESLTKGIDANLVQFKDSKEYQAALLAYQKTSTVDPRTSDLKMTSYKNSAEAKRDEEERNDFRSFHQKIVGANSADLNNLGAFQDRLSYAPPGSLSLGEVTKMNTQAAGKIWESNLRLSIQLAELLKEIRSIHEELARNRVKEKIAEKDLEEGLQSGLVFTGVKKK